MADKNEVMKESLKHNGFFSYRDLYNFCYAWLKNEGYKLSEDEYLEKVAGSSKEVKIKWKASKKVTDYYKNVIEMKWHILGLTDAEVVENGKTIKTQKGEVKIVFEATLERDYEDNWDKRPFWKIMRAIYDKYIMRTTQDEFERKLMEKTISYIEEVKAFLNLEGRS
jgi:hypothetical protein